MSVDAASVGAINDVEISSVMDVAAMTACVRFFIGPPGIANHHPLACQRVNGQLATVSISGLPLEEK